MKSSLGCLTVSTPITESTEDAITLMWAHPDNVDEMMDRVFFANLLIYHSDVHEKRVSLNPFQIMLTQKFLG